MEARRRFQGALGQGFLGQDLGRHVAEDLGLLGDAGEDLGQGLRAGGGSQAQQEGETTSSIVRRSGR
jgi:hypothetical protein